MIGKLMWMPRVLLVASLISLSCLAGCKPANPPVSVHGSVTDEKGALSEGLVTFVPEKGTPGPKISVPVKEGAYEVGADAGLQAGKYAVEVFGLPPGVKAMMNGQPVSHEKSDYREIAAKYNSQSILSTILKEGDNEYSFTVEHQ